MSTFRKAVLNVGTYYSPDGRVDVTPQRLKHWASQLKRVQAAGYTVPMHWDHAANTDIELLEPIKMATRSAQHTVGKLKEFSVAPDGKSAELTVETLTPSATEAAANNTVFVSPVLFSSWTDGAGNEYTDTIGSVDLVDYPVDHSQGPFLQVPANRMSCAIRMSAAPKQIFRLGPSPMPFDKKKNEDELDIDGDGSIGTDEFGSEEAPESQTQPAEDTTEQTDSSEATSGGTSVSDVVMLLSQLHVILPEDTTTENFLERLRPALMTAAAANTEEKEEEPATELPPEKPMMTDQPQIAAMALQKRIKQLEAGKIEAGRASLNRRLKTLLETGRVTPNEHHALTQKLSVQKLSLTENDTIRGGDVAVWIRSREATPKGSCWSANERVQRLGIEQADAPDSFTMKGIPSKQEEDEAVKRLTRRI